MDKEEVIMNAPQSFLLTKNGAAGSLECKMVSPSGREDDCFLSQVGQVSFLSQVGQVSFLSQFGKVSFLSQVGQMSFLSQVGQVSFLSQVGKVSFLWTVELTEFTVINMCNQG